MDSIFSPVFRVCHRLFSAEANAFMKRLRAHGLKTKVAVGHGAGGRPGLWRVDRTVRRTDGSAERRRASRNSKGWLTLTLGAKRDQVEHIHTRVGVTCISEMEKVL